MSKDTIEFWRREDGELSSISVISYENEDRRKTVVGADEIVVKSEKISIQFSYPLSVKVAFEFESKGGFTRMDLFRCVYEGYKRIYGEEEEEVGDPGLCNNMYNRRRSNGKYGIWGHYLDDLYLEGITYDEKEKKCYLTIGS